MAKSFSVAPARQPAQVDRVASDSKYSEVSTQSQVWADGDGESALSRVPTRDIDISDEQGSASPWDLIMNDVNENEEECCICIFTLTVMHGDRSPNCTPLCADFKEQLADLNTDKEVSTSACDPPLYASAFRERDPLLTIAKGSSLVSWNDFKEEGVLGQGSYGRAVKAKWKGETVVVKQIRVDYMNDEERKDARNEVTILSKLDHPN
eukprot:7031017-Pyramimonas_sp.AAC.1